MLTVRWKTTVETTTPTSSTSGTHQSSTTPSATARPATVSTCSISGPVTVCVPMLISHCRSHSCRIFDMRAGSSRED